MRTHRDDPNTLCPICARLGEYLEIENAQESSDDTDVAEEFPDEMTQLQVPNEPLEHYYRYKNERLMKCPHCGRYYWYRLWAPGGSEDVLRTYIHESLRRLSYLEAHVELDDARYQAREQAQEYGGSYVQAHVAIANAVQEEMALLAVRYREIVQEALDAIENKHRRSQELAKTLELLYPQRDHAYQIEPEREREERAAAYHASVLAAYLQHWTTGRMPLGLVRRLVCLLEDDNQAVRQTILEALSRWCRSAPRRSRLTEKIARAAQELMPGSAELGALLGACREPGTDN